MLCPSHDPPLSEGEKLSSAHGILLQLLQSRTLLQEKLVMKVTLYILCHLPPCTSESWLVRNPGS